MVRCLLLTCGLSMLQSTARADDRILWVGKSPCLILVHEIDKAAGSLVFRQSETNWKLLEKEIQRETSDGKSETYKAHEIVEVRNRPKKVAFSLKNIQVYDGTGTRLGGAEVMKRTKPGMQVMIARLGDKIGLDYLFVFKKETLILVVPANQEIPRPEPLPVWPVLVWVLEALASAEDELILHRLRIISASMK